MSRLQDAVRFEYQARLQFEEQNRILRAKLGQEPQQQTPVGGTVVQQQQQQQQQNDRILPVMQSGGLIAPQTYDWVPDPSQRLPVSAYALADQIFPTNVSFEGPEKSQLVYAVITAPTWDGTGVFEHAYPNMPVDWA